MLGASFGPQCLWRHWLQFGELWALSTGQPSPFHSAASKQPRVPQCEAHTYKRLQEQNVTLSSNTGKIIEDSWLWTMPSCQAYLEGSRVGNQGPRTHCIVLLLFELSMINQVIHPRVNHLQTFNQSSYQRQKSHKMPQRTQYKYRWEQKT